MTIQAQIEQRLQDAMTVHFMTLENESYMHSVPANSETHFKLVLVSDAFEGKRMVQRHQLVYATLKEEMPKFHALAMHLHTVKEWQDRAEAVPLSPPCKGGE
ncbi:BolA/IbaG family iron-sulfur metabolism protein [Marinomonas sp. A79]|uniref:BolA/IbaG family iron-sulfur metabolism protein n=1 Tax=Marinomonas vulgaris TaxID=2823372 RepID=A0ABS5HAF9_9GAMM|nr:BolA/IbaG family iron-sulfur metabolism protein [Marinomonas vulgaris]MBR7888437.1 BolA/IbaG family iron-sulfur metabolism protein [Marinomonas vulgaris]